MLALFFTAILFFCSVYWCSSFFHLWLPTSGSDSQSSPQHSYASVKITVRTRSSCASCQLLDITLTVSVTQRGGYCEMLTLVNPLIPPHLCMMYVFFNYRKTKELKEDLRSYKMCMCMYCMCVSIFALCQKKTRNTTPSWQNTEHTHLDT